MAPDRACGVVSCLLGGEISFPLDTGLALGDNLEPGDSPAKAQNQNDTNGNGVLKNSAFTLEDSDMRNGI